MATTPSPAENLLDDFARLPVTKTLLEQLALGSQRKAGGLWGGSAGLLVAALHRAHRGTMLVLTADDVDSIQLQTDLAAFGVRAHVLPREEQGDVGEPDAASRSERQRTLQHFAADKAPLIAGVEAMLQPVATPKHLGRSQFEVRAGQDLDRAQVLQRAQAAGLRAVPLVLAPGECSMRGDVVDLYPMAADAAVRLEFLDRTLESILRLRPWARPTRHRARRSPRSATERARGSSGSSRAIGGAGVARPEVRLPYWRQGRLLRATGSGMPLAGVDPS